jgi:hypothetical protein
MSHEITPPPETINEMKRKENAFRLLMEIAVAPERQASEAETAEILTHLHYVLRYKMGCWYSMWTPQDVIEYAESSRLAFTPTIDQAKDVCHNLEQYEHIYSDISEAVKNEIETLRNSGVNE